MHMATTLAHTTAVARTTAAAITPTTVTLRHTSKSTRSISRPTVMAATANHTAPATMDTVNHGVTGRIAGIHRDWLVRYFACRAQARSSSVERRRSGEQRRAGLSEQHVGAAFVPDAPAF